MVPGIRYYGMNPAVPLATRRMRPQLSARVFTAGALAQNCAGRTRVSWGPASLCPFPLSSSLRSRAFLATIPHRCYPPLLLLLPAPLPIGAAHLSLSFLRLPHHWGSPPLPLLPPQAASASTSRRGCDDCPTTTAAKLQHRCYDGASTGVVDGRSLWHRGQESPPVVQLQRRPLLEPAHGGAGTSTNFCYHRHFGLLPPTPISLHSAASKR